MLSSPAHSRSSFLLSPFPMTGRGQIIPVEATEAFGEQQVARCRVLWGRTLPPVPSKTRPRDELSSPRAQSRPKQDDIGHQLAAPALTELRQGSQGVAEPSPAHLLQQCRHKGQWKLAQLGPWDPLSPFLPEAFRHLPSILSESGLPNVCDLTSPPSLEVGLKVLL